MLRTMGRRTVTCLVVAAIIAVILVCPAVAQTVVNGSFEDGTVSYGPAAGWTSSFYFATGISTADAGLWYNNGLAPDGSNVAFIQTDSSATLSQDISGLKANKVYQLSYYENSRVFSAVPTLSVSIGSTVIDAAHSVPNVGDYAAFTAPFTKRIVSFSVPTDGTYTLSFNSSSASGDSTLLLDKINIIEQMPVASVGDLRKMPNNAYVKISSAVVTGIYGSGNNSTFYIEQEDRSAGIKVVSNNQTTVVNGERITVYGIISTNAETAENEIILGDVESEGIGTPLTPLGIRNSAIAMPFAGSGLITQGLFVKTWGCVTAVDDNNKWFYIDDGAGWADGSHAGAKGIRCIYDFNSGTINVGDYIAVTGCVGNDLSASPLVTTVIPVVRAVSVDVLQGKVSLSNVSNYAGHQCLLFSNGQTGLYVDAANFSLVDVKDKTQNISYVTEPGGNLFLVNFLSSGTVYSADGSGANQYTYDLVQDDQNTSTLHLNFIGCPIGSSGHTCDAIVSITLRADDPIARFGLKIKNYSSTIIREAHFPTLGGLGSSVAGSASTDYMVAPGYQSFYNPRSVSPDIQSTSTEYPGGIAVQMLSYSDGLDRGGLYLAAEDSLFFRKYFQCNPGTSGQSFKFEVVHYPQGTPANTDWILPYRVAFGPVQGDWYDAAKIYRRTLLAQGKIKRVVERTDLPDWFLNTNVWYQGQDPSFGSDNMAAFITHLQNIRTALGQPYAFHLYLWWKGNTMATGFPDYFPAESGFANAVTTLRNAGVELMPYIDIEMMDTSIPMWSSDNAGLWASRSLAGDFNPVFTELRPNVNMCPGTQYWQDKMVSCINTLVQSYGVRSVYLDELHYHPPLCYASNHSHADIGGNYLASGYRSIISRAKAESGISDLVLTGEHSSETYADLVSGQLSWAGVFPSALPMTHAIYKDCTVEFGMMMMSSDLANMDSFAGKIGLQLVQGRQLGWINLDQGDLLGRSYTSQMSFLKRSAQCRSAAKDFLLYGEFLRPPDTSSAGTHTVNWSLAPIGGASQQTIPNVMASAYKAVNGDIGIVLVNVTSTSRSVSVPVNSKDWGLAVGNHYEQSIWSNGAWSTATNMQLGSTLPATIPAYSSIVIRLHQ